MTYITLLILIVLFLYFFRLGMLHPIKGINYLLIFFVFYYLIKYSFVYVQDSIVALWIDATLIGFCTPLILSVINKRQTTNQILLIKIFTFILYGFFLLLITISFNELTTFKAFDRLREYMLFPILAYSVFLITVKNIENPEKIFKTITVLCGIGVLFFIIQFVYINILNGNHADFIWVRNRYGVATHDKLYNLEFMPIFYTSNYTWARIPGIFVQSHRSAHFMSIGFICFFSILVFHRIGNKFKRSLLGVAILLIFVSVFISFVKMAVLMILFFLLFNSKYFLIKPYKLIMPGSIILGLSIIYFSVFERYKEIFYSMLQYIHYSKAESINQYLTKNNIITFFTGNGFLDPLTAYKGLSGDDFLIFFLTDQIGFIGILLFLLITLPPLFFSLKNIKSLIKINYIQKALKGIVLIGLISTWHYSTLLSYGIQAIFYISVGILYGLKWWDNKLPDTQGGMEDAIRKIAITESDRIGMSM